MDSKSGNERALDQIARQHQQHRLPTTAAEVHAFIGAHAELHDRRGTGFAPSDLDAYTVTIEGLLAAFRAAEQAGAQTQASAPSAGQFTKTFNRPGYGQVVAMLVDGDEQPELRWFAQPTDMGVCNFTLKFRDTTRGWGEAESAFARADESAADRAAQTIFDALGVAPKGAA